MMSNVHLGPRPDGPREWFMIEAFCARPELTYFTNESRVYWFCKTHRDEVLKAGIVLFGRGRAPNLYRRDFEAVALDLKLREQEAEAASAGVV